MNRILGARGGRMDIEWREFGMVVQIRLANG
jgi:hypothetical protein